MKCLKLIIQSPSVKHIIITIINVSINLCAGQGKLQLFPFCSAVCSGWVRLAPQFGTRLEFPHSEMRAGHRLKLFHMMRWDNKIGGESGWAPSLHVPFHSPPADWSAKAEWQSEKIILLYLFFLKIESFKQTDRWRRDENTDKRDTCQRVATLRRPVSVSWKPRVSHLYLCGLGLLFFTTCSRAGNRKWDHSQAVADHAVSVSIAVNAVNALLKPTATRMRHTCTTATLKGQGAKKRGEVITGRSEVNTDTRLSVIKTKMIPYTQPLHV